YARCGRHDEALELYAKAGRMNGEALWEKAMLLHGLGRNEEALDELGKVPRNSRYEVQAALAMIGICDVMGEEEKALAAIQRAGSLLQKLKSQGIKIDVHIDDLGRKD
ncbi:MAG: hypothetical protein WC759_05340, partial [Candidatus Micrarchaeia archaeon]